MEMAKRARELRTFSAIPLYIRIVMCRRRRCRRNTSSDERVCYPLARVGVIIMLSGRKQIALSVHQAIHGANDPRNPLLPSFATVACVLTNTVYLNTVQVLIERAQGNRIMESYVCRFQKGSLS